MRRAYFAPLLLALVALVLVACGAGPDDEVSGEPLAPVEPVSGESGVADGGQASLDPEVIGVLTAAATTTAELGSVRMELVLSMEAPGLQGAFDLSASGEFDLANQRGRMAMDYSGLVEALGPEAAGAEGFLPDRILVDGLTMYMRFPGIDQLIPDAKPWVRMDLGEFSAQQGLDADLFGQLGQSDPTQLLAWLQATGTSVTEVGNEAVRGVSTTRFSASVDLNTVPELVPEEQRDVYRAQLAQLIAQTGLSELPIDVWIDEQDRVRRVATELRIEDTTGLGTGAGTVSLAVDLFDFGTEVTVKPPKESNTMDFTELLQSAPLLPS